MFKIVRVFVGTVAGLLVADYLNFIATSGIINYLWGTLIIMAAVFVLRGFHF